MQNVSGFYFFFLNDNTTTALLNPFFFLVYLNKVFGAGQLDVAAQAVSARSDTLGYLKGEVLEQVFKGVIAVYSCLQLSKLDAPVNTNHS